MKKTWKHSWAAAIFGATAFVTTSTSQANVIVYWEEVPNGSQTDVVATWTGSLDPGEFVVDSYGSGTTVFASGVDVFAFLDGAGWDVWRYGSAANTALVATSVPGVTPSTFASIASTGTTFGFSSGNFYYGGAVDGAANSTTINFDDTLHSIRFPSNTLAGMNAAGFSNTLAWTSSSGDSIYYTTGSPPTVSAIPEPSSGLVLGFLLLSGLIHRRRK